MESTMSTSMESTIPNSIDDLSQQMRHFDWVDYLVFSAMIAISGGIGVYFGFCSKQENTASEYLMGGRKMGTIPISLSLISSYISGITIVGTPAEIYAYGTQYCVIIFAVILTGFTISYVYIPVFHEMQLTSSYEYLEKRFNRSVRILGSALYSIFVLTWIPIVIYVPALAFNQVTGVNIHVVTPVVCLVCIFYTTVGGLKAVVWADSFQTVIMFGSMLFVIGKSTIDAGGFSTVWEKGYNSGRIEFSNFDTSPLVRHTVWTLIFGGWGYWLQECAVHQSMVQRYLALPTVAKARQALWIFVGGGIFLIIVCSYTGLVIYATYEHCDPLTTGLAQTRDQLLPLLVMQSSATFRGLPGIFVAGVFSAALSSMSTSLNSMAAIVLEDFYPTCFKKPLTQRQTNYLMKLVVVVIGVVCLSFVFVVQYLGGILQATISLTGLSGGAMLGIFTLGLVVPWANVKGAISGGLVSLVLTSWVCLGTQSALSNKILVFPEKPRFIDNCTYLFPPTNVSVPTMDPAESDVFPLYRISYLWYTFLGMFVVCIVGIPVSFLTGPCDPREMDPMVYTPVIRRFLPKKKEKMDAELSLLDGKKMQADIIRGDPKLDGHH